MYLRLFPVLLLLVVASSCWNESKPKGPDAAQLTGTWNITAMKKNGKASPNLLEGIGFAFTADGQMSSDFFMMQGKPNQLTFKLEESLITSPADADIKLTIVELSDKQLVLQVPLVNPNTDKEEELELTLSRQQ